MVCRDAVKKNRT
jgi:hypothetical protein